MTKFWYLIKDFVGYRKWKRGYPYGSVEIEEFPARNDCLIICVSYKYGSDLSYNKEYLTTPIPHIEEQIVKFETVKEDV